MAGPPSILLLERDGLVASRLVIDCDKAGAEVITADHAVQALQRLAHFAFAAAIIDYWQGAEDRKRVAERLIKMGVPFVVHTAVEPPAEWRAPCFADPDQIVAAVMELIRSSRTPSAI